MSKKVQIPTDVRQRFAGRLVDSADSEYDETRRVHNGMIDRRPALVARCVSTADVVDALSVARASDQEIAVRGGGHNVAGKATCDGVVVDLSLMRDVEVDASRNLIHAAGGATWADLDRAAHLHGLATTGGTVSTTGVAGLTLGGGLGYLMGAHGLAADNLIEADVVTATGEVLHISEDNGADLLWGLRGGGGNFGIVTRFTFRGYPITEVLGGIVAYPFDTAAEVLTTFRSCAAEAPDELGVVCGLVHAPDGSGVKIAALPMCHAGDAAQAIDDVKPLRTIAEPALDVIGPIPYPTVNTLLDAGFPKGAFNYWKSTFLSELNDEAVDVLVAAYEQVPSAMSCIVVEHLHGAATRVPVEATAYPHRRAGFNVLVLGQWADPTQSSTNIAWAKETHEALQPWSTGGTYVNYMSADDSARVSAAYGSNLARLAELKRQYDPSNVFHLNHNIDPGS